MKIHCTDFEESPLDYTSIDESLDLLLEESEELLSELERIKWILPTAALWDRFDPLFRNNSYWHEEAVREKLQEKLRILRRYEAVIEKEIKRCMQNLGRISSDAAHLRLDQPRRLYSEAEDVQRTQHEKASEQAEKVKKMIGRAQNAVRNARTNWHPRETAKWQPRAGDRCDPLKLSRYVPATSNQTDRTFDDELGDLLSLGPPKKREFQK